MAEIVKDKRKKIKLVPFSLILIKKIVFEYLFLIIHPTRTINQIKEKKKET